MRNLLPRTPCRYVLSSLLVGLAAHRASSQAAPKCDIEVSGPICLSSQSRVVVPPARPSGLVGRWTFDDEWGSLDTSGGGNHGMEPLVSGPSLGGMGRSAFFQRNFLTVPFPIDTGGGQLGDLTVTFWVQFLEEPGKHHQGLQYCPLVRKGLDRTVDQVAEAHTFAAAPAIMFDQHSRQLHVELATDIAPSTGGSSREAFDSHSRLSRGRWFHIALVRIESERLTRLYVNGILDMSMNSQGHVVNNPEPLYVGGDPVVGPQCATPMYIDELKVYSMPLGPDEIQAEASPAFAGIEPAYVRLSCMDCPVEHAMQNCPQGYHVCNQLELHVAGYQVARTLGWLSKDTRVWSHAAATAGAPGAAPSSQGVLSAGAATASAQGSAAPLGLGLCCMDSP